MIMFCLCLLVKKTKAMQNEIRWQGTYGCYCMAYIRICQVGVCLSMFGYLEYPVDEVDHIAFWDFTNNDYGYCGECVEN